MSRVKKETSPIIEKLDALARRIPGASFVLPEPLQEGEEMSLPTASRFMGPVGMTRATMAESLLRAPRVKSEVALQEVAESLRVILKGLPNKVVKQLSSFRYRPEDIGAVEQAGKLTRLGEGLGRAGTFRKATGKSRPEIGFMAVQNPDYRYTLPEVISHEGGHAAHARIARRLEGPKENFLRLYDDLGTGKQEAIAEYLEEGMLKKAGLPYNEKYWIPKFSTFAPTTSRNPYMNVYRYLQDLMRR